MHIAQPAGFSKVPTSSLFYHLSKKLQEHKFVKTLAPLTLRRTNSVFRRFLRYNLG